MFQRRSFVMSGTFVVGHTAAVYRVQGYPIHPARYFSTSLPGVQRVSRASNIYVGGAESV